MKIHQLLLCAALLCASSGAQARSHHKKTARENLLVAAQSAGDLNTFCTLATSSGLALALSERGPVTVFAPTDAAFGKLPAGTVDNLLQPRNRPVLSAILRYHILPGIVTGKQLRRLKTGASLNTLAGEAVFVRRTAERITLDPGMGGTADVLRVSLKATNGVIHPVDSVLIPPSVQRALMRASQPR